MCTTSRWGIGRSASLVVTWAALAGCGGAQRQASHDTTTVDTVQRGGVNDELILAAAKAALPPPGASLVDLPDPQSDGARYLAQFCATCHSLPTPAMHSATDWPSVARRMWLRMDLLPAELRVPVPTDQQRQAMLNYVIAHALEVSGTTLPEGPGRAAFSKWCSRCHALPDPRQHSSADWPTVILRMEQHMNELKVDPPSQAAVSEILTYLYGASGRRQVTP